MSLWISVKSPREIAHTFIWNSIHPLGCTNRKKRAKYKTVPSRPSNGGVSTNFPNFANKLSDVKIPKWIVKVLISSAILQFPSVLPFSSVFPEIFVSYFCIVTVKRENATCQNRARQIREWDFVLRKTYCLYYIIYIMMYCVFWKCPWSRQRKRSESKRGDWWHGKSNRK